MKAWIGCRKIMKWSIILSFKGTSLIIEHSRSWTCQGSSSKTINCDWKARSLKSMIRQGTFRFQIRSSTKQARVNNMMKRSFTSANINSSDQQQKRKIWSKSAYNHMWIIHNNNNPTCLVMSHHQRLTITQEKESIPKVSQRESIIFVMTSPLSSPRRSRNKGPPKLITFINPRLQYSQFNSPSNLLT